MKKYLLILSLAVALDAQVKNSRNGVLYPGATSGGIAFQVANVGGTPVTLVLPTDSSSATDGKVLSVGASTTCPTSLPATFPQTCRSLTWATGSTAQPVIVNIPGAQCAQIAQTAQALISTGHAAICMGGLGGGANVYGAARLYINAGAAVVQLQVPIAFSSVDFGLLFANEASSTQNFNVATKCVGAGEDPRATFTWNATQAITSASGTNLQSGSITGLTMTGCSVGELLLIKLSSSTTDSYANIINGQVKFNP